MLPVNMFITVFLATGFGFVATSMGSTYPSLIGYVVQPAVLENCLRVVIPIILVLVHGSKGSLFIKKNVVHNN